LEREKELNLTPILLTGESWKKKDDYYNKIINNPKRDKSNELTPLKPLKKRKTLRLTIKD